MTRYICDIHSHGRYLRAIKLACRRCHVGQHFSIVFTQFDLFLCYLAQYNAFSYFKQMYNTQTISGQKAVEYKREVNGFSILFLFFIFIFFILKRNN